MAKITNKIDVKELKKQADEQGIEYKKNATTVQMQELLTTDEQSIKSKTIDKINVNALLEKINSLEKLVRGTGNHNKIKEYEDAKKGALGFSFTLKLFADDDGKHPVINWVTLKNYVARSNDDTTVQKMEITYLKKGKEIKQKIDLVDFVRILERTNPILAKSLNNLDGTEVYVDEKPSLNDDGIHYIIKPKAETFNVTLNYNGEEITILSTYLNA